MSDKAENTLAESLRRIVSANRRSREAHSEKMSLLIDATVTGGDFNGIFEGEGHEPLGEDGADQAVSRVNGRS